MALIAWILFPIQGAAAEIQVMLPGELAGPLLASKREIKPALISFEPGVYEVRHEATHFQVEVRIPFQVVRSGEAAVPLFGAAVYLQESRVESAEPELARLVNVTNRLGLFVQRPGAASLQLSGPFRKYAHVRGKGFFGQTRRERRAYPEVDL